MERKYYLADPNGKSFKAIKTWQQMSGDAITAALAVGEEFGAKTVDRAGDSISAFHFDADPGPAWRQLKNHGKDRYFPHQGTKAGKELAKRIKAIKIPTAFLFAGLLGGGRLIISGGRYWTASFEVIGDAYIVSIPVGDGSQSPDESFVPPDATPLKLSEYYALKEAAEAAK